MVDWLFFTGLGQQFECNYTIIRSICLPARIIYSPFIPVSVKCFLKAWEKQGDAESELLLSWNSKVWVNLPLLNHLPLSHPNHLSASTSLVLLVTQQSRTDNFVIKIVHRWRDISTHATVNSSIQIEDITWPRGDTKFLFSCWKIFHSFATLTRKIFFQHEKRNFVSPSGHVMFYLLYKHQWNTKPFHFGSFLV